MKRPGIFPHEFSIIFTQNSPWVDWPLVSAQALCRKLGLLTSSVSFPYRISKVINTFNFQGPTLCKWAKPSSCSASVSLPTGMRAQSCLWPREQHVRHPVFGQERPTAAVKCGGSLSTPFLSWCLWANKGTQFCLSCRIHPNRFIFIFVKLLRTVEWNVNRESNTTTEKRETVWAS